MIGFSGDKGVQDLFSIIKPLFDNWIQSSNLQFEDNVQYLCNILGLLKENCCSAIYSNGCRASQITPNGAIIHDCNSVYPGLLSIGIGLDMVIGSFSSTAKTLPSEKVTEAIEIVSKYFPTVVGGNIDMFNI